MSENVFELNAENFDKLTFKGRWVLDFWAPWCGPCVMMKPVFEAVAKEMNGKAKFGKIDIEENQFLAERFGVMSIPTILMMENGEVIDSSAGYVSKDILSKRLREGFN